MKPSLRSLVTGTAISAAIGLSIAGTSIASARSTWNMGNLNDCQETYQTSVVSNSGSRVEARLALKTCLKASNHHPMSRSSISSTSSMKNRGQTVSARVHACLATFRQGVVAGGQSRIEARIMLRACLRAAVHNNHNNHVSSKSSRSSKSSVSSSASSVSSSSAMTSSMSSLTSSSLSSTSSSN